MAAANLTLVGVRLDDGAPETADTMPLAPSVWIEWSEEIVPKAGPRAGRKVTRTMGVAVPLVIFKAAHAALGE